MRTRSRPPAVPMPEDFAPADADRVEAEEAKTAIEPEVAVLEGGKPPAGWRIDRFGKERVRLVSVPPWSRRPPDVEPEVWIGIGRAARKELRLKWETEDPSGFQAQEAR